MPDPASLCATCGAPLESDDSGGRRCAFCGATYGADSIPEAVLSGAVRSGASSIGLGAGLFVAAFGVLWTIAALSIGAPIPFALFGLVFAGFAGFLAFSARRMARTGGLGRGSRREFDRDDAGDRGGPPRSR